MANDSRRNDLGDFLRARRAEVTPAAVGFPDGGARRVPGLRREEVAVLAAISTDYYARLEHGRMHATPAVLDSLARVLDLDADQRAYLNELAARADQRVPSPRRRPHGSSTSQHSQHSRDPQYEGQSQLQRILDAMAGLPAFVFGPRTEVVAWNAMGAALITDFAAIPREQRYYIRILVTDPAMRTLYADWEDVTRLAIAQMRMHNAANPADRQLAQVVEELSLRDPPVSAVVGGARRGRPRHRRQTSAAPDRR